MSAQAPAIPYRLVRSQRRSIGLVIDRDGLTIRAPLRASVADIEAAIASKRRWIESKLAVWREREDRRVIERWEHGGTLVWEGTPRSISVFAGTPARVDLGSCAVYVTAADPAPAAVAQTLGAWVIRQARQRLGARAGVLAERAGDRPRRILISNARTRWGSCSSDGTIRLNWRLIQVPPALADYVVAHELAHLREMNHSPRFWARVGELFPDYRTARRALRDFGWLLEPGDDGDIE